MCIQVTQPPLSKSKLMWVVRHWQPIGVHGYRSLANEGKVAIVR